MAAKKNAEGQDDGLRKAKAQEKPDAQAPAKADDDGVVEVTLSDPEEDEGEETDEEEPRLSRADKKRNRYRDAQEQARIAREEATQLRQQNEQMVAQYQQWQQQLASQQQQQQAQLSQSDPEVDRLYQEQRDMYAAFRAAGGENAPRDVLDEFDKRAREFEIRKHAVLARKAGAGQQQYSPQQIAYLARVQAVADRHRDVLSNQAAYVWADGTVRQRVAMGEAYNEALLDDVADQARQKFGLGGQRRRPQPDEATRARYSGVASGSRGGGADSGPSTVRVGPAEKKMAIAMYPKLGEAEAIKLWANTAGRRAAQKSR